MIEDNVENESLCNYLDEWIEYIYPKEDNEETPPEVLGDFLEEEIIPDGDEGWEKIDYIEGETTFEEVNSLDLQTPEEEEEAKRRASSQGIGMLKSYSIEKLKTLRDTLSYKYLGENSTYSVIVASSLNCVKLTKYIKMLKDYRETLGWSIDDIKDFSHSI